nr:RNA-dependent RNA polymerase 6 [Tanacetum cinerariifolium]
MKNVMNINQMLADNDVAYDVITISCTESENTSSIMLVSNKSVENCFAKHGSKFIKTNRNLTVIEGYVVIAKNPCLHPSDIQDENLIPPSKQSWPPMEYTAAEAKELPCEVIHM